MNTSSEVSSMRHNESSDLKRMDLTMTQCIAHKGANKHLFESIEKYVGKKFPNKPSSVLVSDDVYFYRPAPREVWIIGPPDQTKILVNENKNLLEFSCSTFDQTQGYVLFELIGAQAFDQLAHGVSLDLSASSFSAPSAALTMIDSIPGMILKTSNDPIFILAIAKSYVAFFDLWWQRITSS